MTDGTNVLQAVEWRQTACILCECNCGVEVRLGGDGRTFERIRGDKAHPLRRRPDGTYEEIDWDTAVREVAERLAAVRDTHGGESIVYSHGIPHARTTLKAIAADPDRAMVVIDPRVTETAAMADYHLRVLPAATQYEKFEATFFNFDFRGTCSIFASPFWIRRRVRCPSRRSTPASWRPSVSSTP